MLDCRDKRRRQVRAYISEPPACAGLVGLFQAVDGRGGDRKLAGHQVIQEHADAVQVAESSGRFS